MDELLSKLTSKEQLNEISSQLFKQGIKTLLKAEMTAHLGHEAGAKPISDNKRNGFSEKTIRGSNGSLRISIPRDRTGTFDPVIIKS